MTKGKTMRNLHTLLLTNNSENNNTALLPFTASTKLFDGRTTMLNGVRLPLSGLAAYYPWGRWDAAPPPRAPPPIFPSPALPVEILSQGTMKRHLPLPLR